MRLRRLPKEIPLYNTGSAKVYSLDHAMCSLYAMAAMKIAAAIAVFPFLVYYNLRFILRTAWVAMRWCTYTLPDKDEQAVQNAIRRIRDARANQV